MISFFLFFSLVSSDCPDSARTLADALLTERAMAIEQSKIEREWWKDRPIYENREALLTAFESGELIRFLAGDGYAVSAKITYNLITPPLQKFLEKIVQEWRATLVSRQLDSTKHRLIVTSAVRSQDQQSELILAGAPAAEVSSHTRGVALDIGKAWFEAYDPAYGKALQDVLEQMASKGQINLIREDIAGVWHICLSPQGELEVMPRP